MQGKIGKRRNSLAVRIPSQVARITGLEERDAVTLNAEDGRSTLQRAVRCYSLEELVGGISAENRHDEKAWVSPGGAEAW
jgi:antitoxin MazE